MLTHIYSLRRQHREWVLISKQQRGRWIHECLIQTLTRAPLRCVPAITHLPFGWTDAMAPVSVFEYYSASRPVWITGTWFFWRIWLTLHNISGFYHFCFCWPLPGTLTRTRGNRFGVRHDRSFVPIPVLLQSGEAVCLYTISIVAQTCVRYYVFKTSQLNHIVCSRYIKYMRWVNYFACL